MLTDNACLHNAAVQRLSGSPSSSLAWLKDAAVFKLLWQSYSLALQACRVRGSSWQRACCINRLHGPPLQLRLHLRSLQKLAGDPFPHSHVKMIIAGASKCVTAAYAARTY